MKILPTATKLARWMAYVGLACGVSYSVGGLVYDLATIGLNWGTAIAFAAIIGMPAMFGILGFVVGALIAIVTGGVGAIRDRRGRRDY